MNRSIFPPWRSVLGYALAVALIVVPTAIAQETTGNVFGRVSDSGGNPLPGVTVTLTGIAAPRVFVTDASGNFRFLGLSPGRYEVSAELAGFGTAARSNIPVNVGRNTTVDMMLQPAVAQTITVTAETPLLDVRKTGTGATVTQVELEEVPSARDPWVILQQIPGIMVDRINVGGNESGQQTIFVAKGANMFQSTFNIDGVNETDMIATGASAQYYDFSSLEEIQVTTGGTDPRILTPGAQINLVTKRGTNEWRGSGRYLLTDGDWQSEPKIKQEALEPVRYIGRPNEINEVIEWGAEVGGPAIRDRLWLWGAFADQDIKNFVAQPVGAAVRFSDDTILKTENWKLNAQITSNNSFVGTYNHARKLKFGRNASPARPPETTWNQSDFGPPGIYKIEDTHIFTPNFYLTGMYSKVNLGFQLQPRGDQDCKDGACARTLPTSVLGIAQGGVWRNSFLSFAGLRPAEQYRLDGSTFFDTGAANHELKFGFGYRTAGNTSTFFWPQDQTIIDLTGLSGVPDGLGITWFSMSYNPVYEYQYTDLYVGDVILMGNLTLHVGARYDIQESTFGDVSGPAHSLLPELLPALTIPGSLPETVDWKSISPRIGATYALGEQRRTLLRAAYNRYADHLGSNTGASALQPYYRTVTFYTLDANRDDRITRNEILDLEDGPIDFFGFDPANPGQVSAGTTRVADGFDPPSTDELILGVEHELLPQFTAGLSYTRREFDDFVVRRPEKTQGAGDWYTAADYILDVANTRLTNGNATGTLPDGTPYSVPVFTLRPGVARPVFFALTNRPGYKQTYDGVELSLTKRMSNRWMLRGGVTWLQWEQDVSEEGFLGGDPTNFRLGTGSSGCSNCNGPVAVPVGTISGSKGAIFLNSEWMYTVNGVYQIPFIETNAGFSINGREGYPILYGHAVRVTDGSTKTVLAASPDIGSQRLEDVFQLDLRLSKDFRVGPVGLQVAVDAFNVTDENTVLQRHPELVSSTGAQIATRNRIREQHSPRVFRVGARLTF